MEFRALKKEEINVRIGREVSTEKVTGRVLLLYKNSRCDMDILDETVGAERWQREHYEVKGNLYCRVGIFFDGIGWVWKSDCGVESYAEKEKGESSDSFKRACFNWGIGRKELYTAPFIFTKSTAKEFVVTKIEFKDKKIIELEIAEKVSGKPGSAAFYWKETNSKPEKKSKAKTAEEPAETAPEVTEQERRELFKAAFAAFGKENGAEFMRTQLEILGLPGSDRLTKEQLKTIYAKIDTARELGVYDG